MKITSVDIFSKLFSANSSAAIADIVAKIDHRKQPPANPVVVNFLYFANAEMRGVFNSERRSKTDEAYLQELLSGDLLLPDGVAMALLYFRWKNPEFSPFSILSQYRISADKGLSNLNGTDFIPQFLREIQSRFHDDVSVYLYGSFAQTVELAAKKIESDFKIRCGFQEGYSPFDFTKFRAFPGKRKILLVGTGSPRQELWIAENLKKLSDASVIFSVGGLFDFLGGAEKRAPEIIRRIRIEWAWRLFMNPKKNFKKAMVSLKFFPRFFLG